MPHVNRVHRFCNAGLVSCIDNIVGGNHAGSTLTGRPQELLLKDPLQRFRRVRTSPGFNVLIKPLAGPPRWILAREVQRRFISAGFSFSRSVAGKEQTFFVGCAIALRRAAARDRLVRSAGREELHVLRIEFSSIWALGRKKVLKFLSLASRSGLVGCFQ